jgi:hypothetical protein
MTSLSIPSGKESVIQKIFRVFQNPHVIYATTPVNSFTIFLLSLFYYRQNLCQVNRQFFRPLPHDKLKTRLKETIHKAFRHRNYGSKFVVLGYNSTYFSNKILFYCRQNLCQVNRQFFRRTSWWSRYVPFFAWCLMEFRYPI